MDGERQQRLRAAKPTAVDAVLLHRPLCDVDPRPVRDVHPKPAPLGL